MLKTLCSINFCKKINLGNSKYSAQWYSSLKMKQDNITTIIKHLDEHAESLAADLLKKQKVIAVPTDTVYGLACSANSPEAIKKLYDIKSRDELKPVAICVSNLPEVRLWGEAKHLPDSLLNKLLPGPVTLVFEKTSLLSNPFLNPHTTKIGIRIPDYGFIQRVAGISGIPIALTSANISSVQSSLSIGEFQSLYPKLTAVFDGGLLGKGLQQERAGSTVVDVSNPGFYKVIREGVAFDQTIQLLESYNIYSE